MTRIELEEYLEKYLSSFLKKCSICDSIFKDTLDKMIICKKFDREDKIKKLLND